ncbi:hypothetical protein PQ478_05875 [Alkalihalophilus pseudofirmus]|uniref:hypothetical protein n=1 Tax=Alkalihalophilus pseudofirmus TaxID=79885 RepID=UPI00259BE54E|nr:hypothetical protein [Alkalihalophilus pseudofirmus]WEG18021.1 hypothetical protein PQ478_05875 [Alkalihalophilus pseudofirmus]
MDEKRKAIIINEIKYWRESKLLPSQYCDFLLTLYSEGEDLETADSGKRFRNIRTIYSFIIVQLSFVFTALVIYFTDFSNGLQMLIGLTFSIIVLIIAKRTRPDAFFLKQFYYFIGALILFLLTIEWVVHYNSTNNLLLSATIILHCVFWLFAGLKWKMRFFTISAILGLVVLGIFWLGR